MLVFKNSLHVVWHWHCLSRVKSLLFRGGGSPSLWHCWLATVSMFPPPPLFPPETCTLHSRPWWWVAGGTGVRLVTLIVWWHSPYWVMINYPISWMGFHNRLLIVSSSTPSIVICLSNNRNSICVTFSMSEGKIRHNLSRASIKADISYLNQKIFSWLVGFQWYKLPLTTLISLIRNLQFIAGLSRPRHCYASLAVSMGV